MNNANNNDMINVFFPSYKKQIIKFIFTCTLAFKHVFVNSVKTLFIRYSLFKYELFSANINFQFSMNVFFNKLSFKTCPFVIFIASL